MLPHQGRTNPRSAILSLAVQNPDPLPFAPLNTRRNRDPTARSHRMTDAPRKILATSALPYANGPIHLGHLVEYIQTDIWVRFQQLRGNHCIYLCADDTHGTAIMIRAKQENRPETELIAEMSEAHQQDFEGFSICFDHYGSTNSEANRETCAAFWQALQKADMVVEKTIEQLYDKEKGIFLADRMVRGTCPHCQSPDQPGDNCSNCGETYSPRELVNPVSNISGTTPESRSASHLFVQV